jgi:N-acetylneuraminic acid mutarotase
MRRAAAALALSIAVACSSAPPDGEPSPGGTGATPGPSVQGGYVWQRGSGLPTPRTEVAVATIETQVFVAGGFGGDGKASDALEMYESAEGEWSRGAFPPLPEPLHHAAMVGFRAQLFVIGGYRADGTASSAVWSLGPQGAPPGGTPGPGTWQRRADMPTARGAHAVAVVGDSFHAIGGASRFGGGRPELVDAHEVFDPKRDTWETRPPFPDPRDHLAAAAIGDRLFVVGGRKLSLATNSARLDIFDERAGAWSRGPDMPTARGGIAAASTDGLVFVFGGEQTSGTFDDNESYDPEQRVWRAGPAMPTARHGVGAGVIHGGVAVVGGGPEPGLSVSDAIEVLVRADR